MRTLNTPDGAEIVATVKSKTGERLEWNYTPYSGFEGRQKKCDLNILVELADIHDVATNFLNAGKSEGCGISI